MICSNVSIHHALDQGRLIITPEPTPRRVGEKPGKCPYQTSSVDLRLGNEIAYFKDGIPAQIDLRKGDFNAMFGPLSETRTLTTDQPYVLRPGKLVLGKTFEKVELPLSGPRKLTLELRVVCGVFAAISAEPFGHTVVREHPPLWPLYTVVSVLGYFSRHSSPGWCDPGHRTDPYE